jgi:hypothetical protein
VRNVGVQPKGDELNKLLEYLGILMLLGGVASTVYFVGFFNTTVTTESVSFMGQSIGGGQQINNLGLMADRQNGLIVSVGSAVLGTIFLFAGHTMTEKMKPPVSAGPALDKPQLCASCGKYYAGCPAFCPNCGKAVAQRTI